MNDLLGITPEDAALLVRFILGFEDMRVLSTADADRYRALCSSLQAHAKLVIPPMGKDKVWYGLTTRRVKSGTTQGQSSTIVRATSALDALRLLNLAGELIARFHFINHWTITGNRQELAMATERGVWAKGSEGWVKVWPK